MWVDFLVVLGGIYGILGQLSGENVCLQEERFTVNVTKYFPKNVTVREFIWCLNVPPRCSSYSYKTVNEPKIVAEQQTKNVQKCCPGFVQIQEKCVSQCDNCVHGICSEEKKCICSPGFYGDSCSTICDSHRWGPYCRHFCDCDRGSCDPITGVCQCPAGWTGSRCEQQCPAGYYGDNCKGRCNCNECNRVSGECKVEPPFAVTHMTIFNTTTNSTMVFRIVNTQPKMELPNTSRNTESTFGETFRETSEATSREPPAEMEISTSTQSTLITFITTSTSSPTTPKFSTTPIIWPAKPVLINRTPIQIKPLHTSTPHPIDIILPMKKWDEELTNSQNTEVKFTHARHIEPKYTEPTRYIDPQFSSREGPTTENINVIKTFESNTFFMTVCVVFAAILLLTTIIFVFLIFKKNYLINKKSYLGNRTEMRNVNNASDNRNSNMDGKNGDYSTVVYAKAKSIFHTPLPEPPVFGNPVFSAPSDKINDEGFEAHIVCSINFPNKTLHNKNKDTAELFYDHPPSTGSYRAASALEPPDFCMNTEMNGYISPGVNGDVNSINGDVKSDVIKCGVIEPVYDEIPCWKLPTSFSQRTPPDSTPASTLMCTPVGLIAPKSLNTLISLNTPISVYNPVSLYTPSSINTPISLNTSLSSNTFISSNTLTSSNTPISSIAHVSMNTPVSVNTPVAVNSPVSMCTFNSMCTQILTSPAVSMPPPSCKSDEGASLYMNTLPHKNL